MKWPCSTGSGSVAAGGNAITETVDASQAVGNGSVQQHRSQDDAAVGYVFQRPLDPEFALYGSKQVRWAQADDFIVDNHDKWKYNIPSNKMPPDVPGGQGSTMTTMMNAGPMPTHMTHSGAAGVTYDLSATAALQQMVGMKQHEDPVVAANRAAAEQLVFHLPMPGHPHPQAMPQQYIQSCVPPPPQQHQSPQQHVPLAPAAKKLWGVEVGVGKDGKGALAPLHHLHHHEQVWRDSTWSTTDHTVSQPIQMVQRHQTGPGGVAVSTGVGRVAFPVGDGTSGGILSPRGSDSTGGLGVKMVEYVLGTSPTSKDNSLVVSALEPRMRALGLNNANNAGGVVDQNNGDKDKAPSPFDKDGVRKDDGGNVVMQNGGTNQQASGNVVNSSGQVVVQNGVQVMQDDDKAFNFCSSRTPGSRQPSPAEEELSKNLQQHSQVVILKQGAVTEDVLQQQASLAAFPMHAAAAHHHALSLAQHQGLTLADSVNQHFEHVLSLDQVTGVQNQVNPYEAVSYSQAPPLQNQQQPDGSNATVLQQHNFDVQVSFDDALQYFNQQLFRSQQQQQQNQQAAAAAAAQSLSQPSATTAAQLQLLQQQQYLAAAAAQQAAAAAAQQQQTPAAAAAAAAFAQPPYVLNAAAAAAAQHGADAAAAAPYVPATLITSGMPQYYGVPQWGVYPANLIQQGGTATARRPLSPTGQESAALQGGYIVPYYDTNGGGQLLVAQNAAAMRNGTPMRLVSPAPLIVQQQAAAAAAQRQAPGAAAAAASLYSGTPNMYATNVNTPTVNGGTLGGVAQTSATLFSGLHAPQATPGPPNSGPFANTSLGTLGSPTPAAQLQSGLGLTSNNTGRRDSFDRNTSAFSPSLEYRSKWPINYGLGGSPSPLTNSLTPPPAAPLQLGGLVNNRVISAAPGAEAKYRATSVATSLTTNNMFGSTSSLFTKLNAGTRPTLTPVTPTLDKPTGRSRLLEEFRNNRYPNLQLRDLANHIVEFSQDQHGSRFIQQKLERATVAEKQLVFNEILSHAYSLMTDVFGNYVIQKFFEFGTAEQKTTLAQKVRGHVLQLALQMYGCRVIQKALESIPAEHQQEIVRELDGHVLKCVKDQNGNHVVQKCIEKVDPVALQFIIKSFTGQVYTLSTHPYGCRVIQRVLEHCTPEQTQPLLQELHAHTAALIEDQFGNYVIQHVLEHGKPEDKAQLIGAVRGKVLTLSQHKFASNVVEKCVTHATRAERALLIEEVCGFNDNALHVMMKDQYANYVVQKMIDVSEPTQRKVLMHKIRPHLNSLRKYTYGKHIIAKLEKFFMKTASAMGAIGSDLGPIGPPSNGVM